MNIFTRSRKSLVFAVMSLAVVAGHMPSFCADNDQSQPVMQEISLTQEEDKKIEAEAEAELNNEQQRISDEFEKIKKEAIQVPADVRNTDEQIRAIAKDSIRQKIHEEKTAKAKAAKICSIQATNRSTHLKIAGIKGAFGLLTGLPAYYCYLQAYSKGRRQGVWALLTLSCAAAVGAIGYDAYKSCCRAKNCEDPDAAEKHQRTIAAKQCLQGESPLPTKTVWQRAMSEINKNSLPYIPLLVASLAGGYYGIKNGGKYLFDKICYESKWILDSATNYSCNARKAIKDWWHGGKK